MRAAVGAAVALLAGASLTVVSVAPPSLAFGSINGLGQQAEHERITRSLRTVFQPGTLDVLAGTRGYLGAVGQPDKLSIDPQFPPSDPEGLGPGKKHCDGGDFLSTAGYPQTREQANAALQECFTYYKELLDQAVAIAAGLVDANLVIDTQQGQASPTLCTFPFDPAAAEATAKCGVLNRLGRALHLAEDFWAHSNWADAAKPGPTTITNPPGLQRTDIPSLLRYPPAPGGIPSGLITGCDDSVPGHSCDGRVPHSKLAKDTGTINPADCTKSVPYAPIITAYPVYERSKTRTGGRTNFVRAVCGAMKQARQTWDDLATAIVNTYGPDRGGLILRSITQDSSVNAAPNRQVTITLTTLTCIDQEDHTGKDDANLSVFVPMPGQTLNTLVFSARMNTTDASVFRINRTFTYNPSLATWGNGSSARSPKDGFVGLELIELDTLDPNDNLGTQFIDPSKSGPGSVTFRVDSIGSKTIGVGESVEYRLDYVVS